MEAALERFHSRIPFSTDSLFVFVFFKSEFLYVAQAVLKLGDPPASAS